MVPVRSKPIANNLLVKALVANPLLPKLFVPIARGVWSEHFIAQGHQISSRVIAKLELCVGKNQPGLCGKTRGLQKDADTEIAKLFGNLDPDNFDGLLKADVLIVLTLGSLEGRSENGMRESVPKLEALRKFDTADLTGLLVFLPART